MTAASNSDARKRLAEAAAPVVVEQGDPWVEVERRIEAERTAARADAALVTVAALGIALRIVREERARAATTETPPACGVEDRTNPNWNHSWLACQLPRGHDGDHYATTGCAGGARSWHAPPAARDTTGEGDREALTEAERERLREAVRYGSGTMPGSYVDMVMEAASQAVERILTDRRAGEGDLRARIEREHQAADYEPTMCVTCLVTLPCPTLAALRAAIAAQPTPATEDQP
jgi:hypothetical protein